MLAVVGALSPLRLLATEYDEKKWVDGIVFNPSLLMSALQVDIEALKKASTKDLIVLDQYYCIPYIQSFSKVDINDINRHLTRHGVLQFRSPKCSCFWGLADFAAKNGQLETLQWIRNNGGDWTHRAADLAAMNGRLETLQWIRANGGEWTHWAAKWAAKNGHLETLQWIQANDGE
jgi:hypothetical protein